MPVKQLTHSNEHSSSRHQEARTENIAPQERAAVQRVQVAPRLLAPQDVLHLQRTIGNRAVGQILGQTIQHQPIQKKENKTGLPDNLKTGIENLSGYSMDDVKVHFNSDKPAQLQAHAYAQGTDIHVAPGQEKHLPHEAWHVVQQKQGRVEATKQMKADVNINDDEALESEANSISTKPFSIEDGNPGSLSSAPTNVYQLAKFTKEETGDYGDLDTDDEKDVISFLELYNDLEKDNIKSDVFVEIKKSLSKYPQREKIEKLLSEIGMNTESEEILEEEPLWKEKAKKDIGGWLVDEPTSEMEKLDFLKKVLYIVRSIIPGAFNRKIEVGREADEEGNVKKDYTNTAYACKDALVHAYAQDLKKQGVVVMNNYIHPAALERMYAIISSTAPNTKAQKADITGVCKDFASICYGLILQNDVSNTFKPKLAFMHGHVYVEVDVGGELYAVDAWFGGEVKPKDQHEKDVSMSYKEISKAKELDLSIGKEHQTSLDASYEDWEKARLVWYKNEARYREIAEKVWSEGETSHVNRGSL